jgi:hypothetical protein
MPGVTGDVVAKSGAAAEPGIVMIAERLVGGAPDLESAFRAPLRSSSSGRFNQIAGLPRRAEGCGRQA